MEKVREVYHSKEFEDFFKSLNKRVQEKYLWTIYITETIKVLPSKYVKKVIDTEFYEMRVSIGYNEYRTIIFATDCGNVSMAKEIYLLNGFLKKSSKNYKNQIRIAIKIMEGLI